MIIIGERINSSRKRIREAMDSRDDPLLAQEARLQIESGAAFIDINSAATMEAEIDILTQLIVYLQQEVGCSISIDSPNPDAIRAALSVHKGKPFVNSITAEREKLERLLPIISENDSYVVALTIDDNGMPHDADGRVALADKIISEAQSFGIPKDNIYIDALVKPVSTEADQAASFLEAVGMLKSKGIKTVGGLSNVSFGLPQRGLLNAAFLRLAMERGIDAAIIDPTDVLIRKVLEGKELPDEQFSLAKDLLLGRDEFSMAYIKAFREGRLEVKT